MVIAAAAVVLIAAGILLILYFYSPGKPRQFVNSNNEIIKNSISEKLFLDINGVKQGMFIKGENINNPVILYLHGGMPDYFLTEKYPTHLEKDFTIVWWEQRGSGISQTSGTVSVDQLIDDTVTLTEYLIKRFGKEKIYLMGHSGGTFIGVHVIERAPELYLAYIGIAQMSDQRRSEKIAYDYMLNKYKEKGNREMYEKFLNHPVPVSGKIRVEYSKIRDIAMHELGIGTMKRMRNLITDLILPSLLFSEYTIGEKYNLWVNKSQSGISRNWESMINTNLITSRNTFSVPVYFFHGIDDYTCSYELAKEYFNSINAPVKGFYTFGNSAHSPIFEEPDKMREILIRDVLNSKTESADK